MDVHVHTHTHSHISCLHMQTILSVLGEGHTMNPEIFWEIKLPSNPVKLNIKAFGRGVGVLPIQTSMQSQMFLPEPLPPSVGLSLWSLLLPLQDLCPPLVDRVKPFSICFSVLTPWDASCQEPRIGVPNENVHALLLSHLSSLFFWRMELSDLDLRPGYFFCPWDLEPII